MFINDDWKKVFKEFEWNLDDPKEYKKQYERWYFLGRWVEYKNGENRKQY